MSSSKPGSSSALGAPTPFRPTATDGPVFHSTLALLEALCGVSSPTGDRDGLIRAMGVYGELLADRGLQVEVMLERNGGGDELPVLVARSGHTPEAGTGLFLIGHMDTVLPAGPMSYRDDRLFATGAADMKGGLACFVGAVDQLQAEGWDLPPDLTLVVVPDEEIAGDICHTMVRRFGATARALWVLEPGRSIAEAPGAFDEAGEDGETIVLARRGLIKWHVDIYGRGAHAGNAYWHGRSAAGSAAHWASRALEAARPGAGPTVNVGRIVAGEKAFVEKLQEHAGLLFSERQTNVVPDRARLEGEMRFRTEAEGDELVRRLQNLAAEVAEEDGTELRFTAYRRIPAWSRPPGPSPADPAVDAASTRGWTLGVEPDRGGISFPNMLPDPSALPILDGLGPTGGGLHTREEFVDLPSFDRRIRLLADLLIHDMESTAAEIRA